MVYLTAPPTVITHNNYTTQHLQLYEVVHLLLGRCGLTSPTLYLVFSGDRSLIVSSNFLHLLLTQVKVILPLRLTVSQKINLGVKPHLGGMTRHLLFLDSYSLVFVGRTQVCLLYMLLAFASTVFLGYESLGTRDHILLSQIRDFHFVTSYDSQGHGGGIRPRLHTGYSLLLLVSVC
jgi:hypothetical protein